MKNNQQGFSLIEAVIAMFILTASVFLLQFAAESVIKIRQSIYQDEQLEWHIFLQQFSEELAETSLDEVTTQKLSVYKQATKTDVYIFEQYKNMVRKRSNHGGHQPMLMKVKILIFKQMGNVLCIKVVFVNQTSYEAFLLLPEKI